MEQDKVAAAATAAHVEAGAARAAVAAAAAAAADTYGGIGPGGPGDSVAAAKAAALRFNASAAPQVWACVRMWRGEYVEGIRVLIHVGHVLMFASL